MPDRLLGHTPGTAKQAPREGLVYVSDKDSGPMSHAREGAVIRISGRGPPWIVVDQEPASVVVPKWPGRLWWVRILEEATPHDQHAVGGPPRPSAGYTRAISVEVTREEDAACLFGPHGGEVLRVLDVAMRLTRPQAEALALHRQADAARAHDRVWRDWMRVRGVRGSGSASLDGALRSGGSKPGSPINSGLSTLHGVVFDRAREIDGEAATEATDEAVWLAPPWSGAERALADAALALGAAGIVGAADRSVLLKGWTSISG